MQEVSIAILVVLVASGFALPVDFDKEHPSVDSGAFEGDILIHPEQEGKHGMTDPKNRWPNGILYYTLYSEDFSSNEIYLIMKAMKEISKKTCLSITLRGNESNYVSIDKTSGSSIVDVGMVGKRQILTLREDSITLGNVLHMLMHAFGFWHQHNDPKRDDYVTVVWDNIIKERKIEFFKYNSSEATDFGVGYDYGSIMHNPRGAVSVDGAYRPTIIPKDPNVIIGQRERLTEKDVLKLNRMYNCTKHLDT